MSDRKQPVCVGLDSAGELIWGAIPMPRWLMEMCPVRYRGDFKAFWYKLNLYQDKDLECDGINADFNSHVPWQLEEKYREMKATRDQKGD